MDVTRLNTFNLVYVKETNDNSGKVWYDLQLYKDLVHQNLKELQKFLKKGIFIRIMIIIKYKDNDDPEENVDIPQYIEGLFKYAKHKSTINTKEFV